jgi:hypothetical protein
LGLAGGAVTMAAIVAPIYIRYAAARRAVAAPEAASAQNILDWSARATDFLTSPTFLHSLWEPAVVRVAGLASDPMFPGVMMLALAIVALVTVRRRVTAAYLAVAAFAFVAAFGPRWHLYPLIAKAVPGMALLRAPVRYGMLVAFALAVLAGFGAERIIRKRSAMTAALVLVTALELTVWGGPGTLPGWNLSPMPEVPRAYQMLASLPRGPVVDFPFAYRRTDYQQHARVMFWSVFHWQPLVNGYSDVVPDDFRDIAVPINAFPDARSFEIMRARNVRYVVWRMDGASYDAESRAKILARFPAYAQYLRPLTTEGDVWLYEITGYPDRPGDR